MAETPTTTATKSTKNRSPEHPAVGLQEAVEKAREFYELESFNYAHVDVAKKHWGYAPKSSSGMRLLAALLHYGLLEDSGDGSDRRVRLTAQAKAILLDRREDSTERDVALQKAALSPAIYRTLWKSWGAGWPISDANMEFELIQKYKFNPDSVRAFIKDFKATVLFAKLPQSSTIRDTGDDKKLVEDSGGNGSLTPPPPPPPKIKSPGGSMPEIQHDVSAQLPPLDLTIPLTGGRRAILRIPAVLSPAEYELILAMVQDNMAKMKPMIVPGPQNGGPVE
jgi:hypothetical protein